MWHNVRNAQRRCSITVPLAGAHCSGRRRQTCPGIGWLSHPPCALVVAQVDEVKGIMTENIDKMLARGERLELLTDKTENLMFEVRQGAACMLTVGTACQFSGGSGAWGGASSKRGEELEISAALRAM